MHSLHRARLLVIVGLAVLVAGGTTGAAERYAGYHRLSEIEAQLDGWARGNPKLIAVEVVGRSAGGHAIRVLRVAAPGSVPPDERPAVFVGANAAGHHNAGTEAALHLINALVETAATDDAELLSQVSFYVVPVLSPDAHDGLFAVPRPH